MNLIRQRVLIITAVSVVRLYGLAESLVAAHGLSTAWYLQWAFRVRPPPSLSRLTKKQTEKLLSAGRDCRKSIEFIDSWLSVRRALQMISQISRFSIYAVSLASVNAGTAVRDSETVLATALTACAAMPGVRRRYG